MFDERRIFKNINEKARIVISNNNILDIVDTLPDNYFKLIITSPPYNIGKPYEKKVSLSDYLKWQEEILEKLVRTLCADGSIVWQVGNYIDKGEVFPLDMYFYPIFKKLGFKLRNRIIWHFEHGLHCQKRFSGRYETLLWFTKNDEYTFNLDPVRVPSKYPGKLHYKGPKKGLPSGNPLGKNPSDYWTIINNELEDGIVNIPNVKSNHPEKTIHPCQFPVELVERCVLAYTDENDWVFDPFGGVGSSLIAAIKHNRKGMIVELEKQYVEIAQERVKKFVMGDLKLRPIGKEIHKPTGREKVAQVPKEWKGKQGYLI
uniref:DNA-methyltransferase n=1 Tax=uncultured Bilophila sp. TaxID=529385 RepID=UPI0025CF9D17|nr:site-specific DNA-methyltransferase [uncultured Bilophila sp.]